jgi:hypothetical protein
MISEFDQQCYGCDIQEFIAQIQQNISYQLSGANMVVAGLMSDAQEELAVGANERARQTLNRAKAVLFEIMDGNLVGNVAR